MEAPPLVALLDDLYDQIRAARIAMEAHTYPTPEGRAVCTHSIEAMHYLIKTVQSGVSDNRAGYLDAALMRVGKAIRANALLGDK